MFNTMLNESIDSSVQSRAKGAVTASMPLLFALATGNSLVPPWWSPARDAALRNFWKRGDHLSGAHYNMIAKMCAIPFKIVPRDYTNYKLVGLAEEETERILDVAEFGAGWQEWYAKVLDDMLATDNGWFSEIIGAGNPAGPIVGRPLTVAHLDSARCQRTGDPTYPVLYRDDKGKLFKLHYSRVMFGSQMPSSQEEMNGVGLCAVSRCLMASQNLIDIAVYKMEKLGSRPHRSMIITKGGLDPEDIRAAFSLADSTMDSQGYSRYSQVIVTGNASMPDSDVRVVDFNTLPDGFDERSSVTLGMAVIAMGYGVDARDLFPNLEGGATRADALLQHLKQRGKGPGQIITDIEVNFNRKFLPRTMKDVFDVQDDAEDMQIAQIKEMRAQRRERDVRNQILDYRTIREQMIVDNDLTQKQFETLELKDGRLLDGTPVIALFHSTDNTYKRYLTIADTENPLDVYNNDPQYILMSADDALMKVNQDLLKTDDEDQKMILKRASAALEQLKLMYTEQLPAKEPGGQSPRNYPLRRLNTLAPNTTVELSTNPQSTLPNKDDKTAQNAKL